MRSKETRREILALTGAVLLISSAALAQAPQENQIHVEIAGLRNDKGQAVCSLFSSAADFPKKTEKAVIRRVSVITDRHAVCEFSGVAPGTYAISVMRIRTENWTPILWGFLARASGPRTVRKAILDRLSSMPPHFALREGDSN